jgi:hypothetical protein
MIELAVSIAIMKASVGAFEYRQNPPPALFPYCRAAMDDTMAGSISNPAYLPLITFPYLSFSGSKPYTLEELNSTTIKVGYSTKYVGMQATWNRFGFSSYSENIAEGGFGYMPVKYVSIGLGISYYHIQIKTRELSSQHSLLDGKISMLIQPVRWLRLSFQQENIGAVFLPERRDLLYPEWSAGVSLKPVPGFSLTWNLNKNHYQFVNTISASVTLIPHLNIRAGYSREALTFSMSLSIVYKYISASYGLRYHPHLGLTHAIGFTTSTRSMEMSSLFDNKGAFKFFEKKSRKKININKCSPGELQKIPGLDPAIAKRIIKYREIFGPLNRKSLFQIGMSREEVNRIIPYISGLKQKEKRGRAPKKRKIPISRQQSIFARLLELNIKASTALEITRLVSENRTAELEIKISSLENIPEKIKDKIRKICAESSQ